MMPIVEFMKCLAHRQKLGLKATNILAIVTLSIPLIISQKWPQSLAKDFLRVFNSEKTVK